MLRRFIGWVFGGWHLGGRVRALNALWGLIWLAGVYLAMQAGYGPQNPNFVTMTWALLGGAALAVVVSMTRAQEIAILFPALPLMAIVFGFSDEPGYGPYLWFLAKICGIGAAGLLAIYALLVIPAVIGESAAFRKWFRHGTGGSARWSGPLAFAKLHYNPKGQAPIYLGKTLAKYDPLPGGTDIGVDDQNHLVTIAQSRSGKSTSAIWPNLALHPYPDSVFVLDPRGDHSILTSRRRGELGRVVIFDPFNETKGQVQTYNYNPLAEIDPYSIRSKEDIKALADGFVMPSGATSSATGDHFDKLQNAIIAGLIAHILTTEPAHRHNLPAVYDYFMALANEDGFKKLLAAMSNNEACGGLPKEAVLMYNTAGQNEKGSIFTTTATNLSWISSEGMRRHLSGSSDFTMADLRTGIVSLYVVLDFDAMKPERQGRYMRLLINLAFEACRKTPLPPERKNRRTLFILDELPQIGPTPSISQAYRTLAGNQVKIWSFFQDYEGLTENYPSASAFMGNSTRQFFGCNDPDTAKAIENYLGDWMAGPRDRRSLLDATEIIDTLGQNDLIQIIITGTGEKLELSRLKYIPQKVERMKDRSQRHMADLDSAVARHEKGDTPPIEGERADETVAAYNRLHRLCQERFGQGLIVSQDADGTAVIEPPHALPSLLGGPDVLDKIMADYGLDGFAQEVEKRILSALEPESRHSDKTEIAGTYTAAQTAAMVRFQIAPPYTQDELAERWRVLKGEAANDNERAQIDEDYKTLLPLAVDFAA